jgi:hypothetical protein
VRVRTRGIGFSTLLLVLLLSCAGCSHNDYGAKTQGVRTLNQSAEVKTDFNHSRVLKLQGKLNDHEGRHLIGVVGVLFSIYEQQEDGAALWQEVQNIEVNDRGRFTALVGSTKRDGIPPELFGKEKVLWLGKQALLPNEVEQPRMRLLNTDDGLVAEYVIAPVMPENSGDQGLAGSQEVLSEQAASQQSSDQQDPNAPANGPRVKRARRGLRR